MRGFLQKGRNMDQYRLARLAYAAYGKTTDFKNFQGNPMPEFDNLPEKIKEAWSAACTSVAADVVEEIAEKVNDLSEFLRGL